jgi:hypothetical protein
MTHRDPIDRNFLIFCLVAFACIAALAIKIYPHPDAPAASTAEPKK